jgi:hypothetical protein
MIGDIWQLVTNKPVGIQDCKKITNHSRGILEIYPNVLKENWRMSTCNRLDVQTLGSQPIMPKILPIIVQNTLKCYKNKVLLPSIVLHLIHVDDLSKVLKKHPL